MRPAIVACLLLLTSASASAEPGFAVERLRPAMGREGIIEAEAGEVEEHLALDLALWLRYDLNPLVLYGTSQDGTEVEQPIVRHLVGANLVAAIALMGWVQVGVDLPFTLYQATGDLAANPGTARDSIAAAGLGDMRLSVKLVLLGDSDDVVNIAVMVAGTVPTSQPKSSFNGDATATFVPELVASRRFSDTFRMAVNMGVRVRKESTYVNLETGNEMTYRLGAAYSLSRLLQVPVEASLCLSGSALLNAPFKDVNNSPAELLLQGAYALADSPVDVFLGTGVGLLAGYATPDFRVFAGARFSPRPFVETPPREDADTDGDGILDAVDACPTTPEDRDGFEDANGCPDPDNDGDGIFDERDGAPLAPEDKDGFEDEDGVPDPDNDGDGIVDTNDRCPSEAEDADGFEDDDGCPDPDNDKDGILDGRDGAPNEPEDKDGFRDEDGVPDPDNDADGIVDAVDQCPNEAEVINGVADDDGCPDVGQAKAKITGTKIEILEKVYFDTGKATIQDRSFDLLMQVARILRANPQITKIRVEGHTDDRGADDFNQQLSQDRADSVRAALIENGVDAARIVAVGYGETRPIASNKTVKGRDANRRVEFMIAEVDGSPLDGPSGEVREPAVGP